MSNLIFFLAIDVVTTKKNISKYEAINKMINYFSSNIRKKDSPLVLMSQVRPHFTRKINWPKKLLYYQVETLIFGDAINRAEKPERIIIGTHNGLKVRNKTYLSYLNLFKTSLIYMNYEEAELCKMFINSYLVANVTLTNNLSNICKKLNLNWEGPKQALMLDKRIGKHAYLKPGLGISGGNLERDIVNLNQITSSLKINSNLFNVFLKESLRQKKWLNNTIATLIANKQITKTSKIGLIGITYKEKTNSIKNSPSLIILKKLNKYNLFCYDDILQNNKVELYNIRWLSLNDIINKCEILFILHSGKKINTLLKKNHLKKKYNNLIIDPFNIVSKVIKTKINNYVSL